jgi:hypothetical protein
MFKKLIRVLEALEAEKYEPYCRHCSSCGEEGCCSPLNCARHCMVDDSNGMYCATNYRSIEFGYRMGIALYNMLSKHEGVEELYDKIYKEVYDEN